MRAAFAADPQRFAKFSLDRRRPAARLVEMRGDGGDDGAAGRCSARPRASRSGARRCSPARRSTSPRTARCCTRRCATAADAGAGRRPGRHARRARRARRHGEASPTRCARAQLNGRDRQEDHRRGQHRHRRLGPRPGDGDAGAGALCTTGRARTSCRTSTARICPTR